MSFNRLPYDEKCYTHKLAESTGAGNYQLKRPKIDCNGCYPYSPHQRLDGFGDSLCEGSLIDVDSELSGINYKNTHCPSDKFIPGGEPFCNPTNYPDCKIVPQEDTLLSNPPCTLRGTGWNRWEWLCQNPQDNSLVPFDYNINNSLIAKDNHRPVLPKPMNPTDSLPQGSQQVLDKEVAPVNKVNEVDTNPNSTHWRQCGQIKNY